MEYKELIDQGKRVFNYHPDSVFESVSALLEYSMKMMKYGHYNSAIGVYSAYMADYIDEQAKLKSPDLDREQDQG